MVLNAKQTRMSTSSGLNGIRTGFIALLLALVVTGASAFAASGQVAAGTAGSYDWPFSCLARNPNNDNVYGFYRRDSGSTVLYSLLQWNGSAWTTVGTFDQPTINAQTPFLRAYDSVSMAIDSTGAFHVAFSGDFGSNPIASTRGVWYGKSATGATGTWTFTAVETYSDPNGWKNTSYPQIKVDQNNRPHIAFQYSDVNGGRSYEAHYRYFDGTTWQGSGATGKVYVNAGNASNEVNFVTFALDSAGKAYFTLVSELNGSGRDGSLLYITNGGLGSFVFSAPTTIAQGQTALETGTNSNILVDSAGKVHIIYTDYSTSIYHATNASGSFVTSVVNGTLTGSIQPQNFTQNSSGDLFFVYRSGAELRYARLISGNTGWATGTLFAIGGNDGGNFYSGTLNNSRLAFGLFDNATTAPPRPLWYATTQLPNIDAFPTVTSSAATSVTSSSATLNGSVNANGVSTTATFEYGLTTGYGATIAATPGTVTGSSATAVSANLTGLIPGATYHFRAAGVNATGAAQGSDQTFSVPAAATVSILGSPAQIANSTTLTSFTVPAGTNRVLIVAASGEAPSGTSASVSCDLGAVTFNGNAMTLIGKVNDGVSGYIVDGLYVATLGTGGAVTGNVVVATAAGTTVISSIGATAFQNVDQAAPVNGYQTKYNAYNAATPGMSSSVTVVSNAGDMVFDIFDYFDNVHGSHASGAGQTATFAQVDAGVTGTEYYQGSVKLGGSSITMGWTTTGATETIQLAANLKQLVTATAPSISSASASAVNYNSTNNSISVATITAPTGNPATGWTVAASSGGTYGASAASSGGGTVSIDSAGAATYSPPTGYRGNDTFFVKASNAIGTSGAATITVPVNNPTFTFSQVGTATQGTVLSGVSASASGGKSPYSGYFTASTLPAGVSLTTSGAFSGTPTQSGNFPLTIQVTDSSTGSGSYTSTGSMTLVVASQPVPTLTSNSATAVNYSSTNNSINVATLTSPTNSPTGWTVAASSGGTYGASAASSGGGTVSINSSGVATYAPLAGYRGNDTFFVKASNAGGTSVSPATITVPVNNPTFTFSQVGTATQGAVLSGVSASASGGKAPYSAFSTASTLPTGVTFTATGTFTGTPTQSGNFPLTIQVTDSSTGTGAFTSTGSMTLVVAAQQIPTMTNASASAVAYNSTNNSINVATLAAATNNPTGWTVSNASGGTYAASAATSSGGTVSINSSGVATVTPVTGFRGNDTFFVKASNFGGTSAAATITVPVNNPTFTATLPASTATVGVAYNVAATAVTISGGKSPYSAFSATGLPNGLTINAAGVISGTPTAQGTFSSVVITATDSSTGTGAFTGNATAATITVAPGTPTATAQPSNNVAFNTAKALTLAGTDPDSPALPLTYAIGANPTHGALSGLNGSTGAVTYTPTTGYHGADSFTFTASNGTNTSAAATVNLT